jgi:NADPH:quinone reductase
MSFVDAAAMALVYDTAWFALRERGRLKPGEVVLVLGASGGVGLAAVQLAKAMGARVFAGVARPEKADLARDAGADAIIDLSAPDLRDDLRQQVYAKNGGNGVDIVIDPIGGDAFDAALRAVAWRGRVVVVGFASGRIPTIKANYLLLKNIEVSGMQVSDYRKRTPDLMAQCMQEIFTLFEAGKLRPSPAVTYPLDQCAKAMQDVQNRRIRGRAVIVQHA